MTCQICQVVKKEIILKKVGKRIKELRVSKGMTQIQLVIKMEENEGKIDTTNISRIEAGRTNPTLYTLHRIATALEVDLIDLVNIQK